MRLWPYLDLGIALLVKDTLKETSCEISGDLLLTETLKETPG